VAGIPPKELFSPTKPTNPNFPISYKILFWHISYSVKNVFHFVVSSKKNHYEKKKINTTMKRI
jgi:hypothetical protein